jgi:hypothetical protein
MASSGQPNEDDLWHPPATMAEADRRARGRFIRALAVGFLIYVLALYVPLICSVDEASRLSSLIERLSTDEEDIARFLPLAASSARPSRTPLSTRARPRPLGTGTTAPAGPSSPSSPPRRQCRRERRLKRSR